MLTTLGCALLANVILASAIDSGAQQGWSHVGAILVGAAGGKLFDYLGKRLDSRVKTLEEKVSECEQHRADCETLKKDHAELKLVVEEIRARANVHHPEDAGKVADATSEHTPLSPR